MLRSLVGSEMCIRDRAIIFHLKTRGKNRGYIEKSENPSELTINIQPPNCLLYTSDAADDLLCVDLGGRRIIKKKTKQTTSKS